MRIDAWRALACAALALASGCAAVGPNYRGPTDSTVLQKPSAEGGFVSTSEAVAADQPVPPDWWRLYQEPELDALVKSALDENTRLRVAMANLARSRAALQEVEAAHVPSTTIGAGASYQRLPGETGAGGIGYDVGVGASYLVDLFGQLRRGIEAARADIEATRAALDVARVAVAADTARAYVSTCGVGHELAVARRLLDYQQESLERTRRLVEAGRSSPVDLPRTLAQVEQLRANIPPLEARQRVELFRLAVLTGKPPAEFPRRLEACVVVPQLGSPLPTGDGAALLRRRPDIRQAERLLAAATARIGVATADLYPSVNIGLSAGFSAGSFRWSLGPLLSWTFPNTRAARARIAGASAEADAALARFDETVLTALLETERALTTYAKDLDRHAALVAARDQAAEAARQVEILFRNGRESFLPVLDAERTLANNEAAVAASQTRLANDQIDLFLALGGGWEQP